MPSKRWTTCNRDCPDACRIVATIEDGVVVRLDGDPDHPITRGFLCARTRRFPAVMRRGDRVREPLLRRGETFEPVSWDVALDRIATELTRIARESGPEAIFHYRSGGSLGMLVAESSERFFSHLGPVTTKSGDICSGASEAAQALDFGVSDSGDLDLLERARHILLWGKNVYTSSPHTLPFLKRAKEAGAELVLVDPVFHKTARLCDRVVAPRPGGDLALAMAVARILFERGWVAPEISEHAHGVSELEAVAAARSVTSWCRDADVDPAVADDLARRLHEGPTTILLGWGLGRRRHGGVTVRAIDALAVLSGNVGRPGAGVSYYFQRRRAFAPSALPEPPRRIREPMFGHDIMQADAPPIRAVWVTAGNPVAMLPDAESNARALRTRDFVVVVDPWMTDTGRCADVVLPTHTLLEADDVVGAYGHHHIGVVEPVVPAPPGVRSELEIFAALAERLGFGDAMAGTAAQWKARLLRPELAQAGIDLASLRRSARRTPWAPRVAFEGGRFATEDGKARLLTSIPAEATEISTDAAYPMALMSLSTPDAQSSQWSIPVPSIGTATLHPRAAPGIANGATAWLVSRLDRMKVRVIHDDRQRLDVVIVPKGGHLRGGTCANKLVRAEMTDLGGGGVLYDETVRIEPAGD